MFPPTVQAGVDLRVEGRGDMSIRRPQLTPRRAIGVAVLVLLVASELTNNGGFFSRATLSTLTPFIGVMAIASFGQAVVIGSGGIDLSIPATMTFVGVMVLKVSQGKNDRLLLAVLVALALCGVIGLVNGLLVERLRLNPFVATLAVGQIVSGAARYVRGPVPRFTRVPPLLVQRARWNLGGISLALIVAVVLMLAGTFTFRSTVWGRRLVASSASKVASSLVGLSASTYRTVTFVSSSVLAGLAAVLLSGQLGSPDLSLGAPYLLATVVSVVLGGAVLSGGRVDLIGVALGAVFITVLGHDLRVQGYSSGFAQLVQALVLGGGFAVVYVIRNRNVLLSRLRGSARPGLPNVPIPIIK